MKFYYGLEDDQFNRLLQDYNNACERQDDDAVSETTLALYRIGAWVDAADCWRHPDDHDERTLPQILEEEEIDTNHE